MKARQFRYYDLLVHIFVVLLLISNLVGQKITAIGPVRVGGAQLLFPLTYIFGDVFTEVYGYGASRRAIWIGFFASTLLSLMCVFMVWLPPAPGWNNRATSVFNCAYPSRSARTCWCAASELLTLPWRSRGSPHTGTPYR